MKLFRFQRATRDYVWIIPAHYGFNPPRGCSRRVPVADFHRDWMRLPQRIVVSKSDYNSAKTKLARIKATKGWSASQVGGKCEKCNTTTCYTVPVFDRHAFWCGCA